MTEVLRISPSPEPQYMPSRIRRTTSHTSLLIKSHSFARSGLHASSGHSSPSTYVYTQPTTSHSSSAPSSPRVSLSELSSECSTSSTPLSSLSLQGPSTPEDEEDDPFSFPRYEPKHASYGSTPEGSSTPTPTKAASPLPPTPAPTPVRRRSITRATQGQSIGDDTDVKPQPSRHVDYLSHDWVEEDIWSSWKHIVGKRGTMENWKRLENASWRAWAKSRSKLPTVHPDKVNWMKDHDVTWLYGPLQSLSSRKIKASSPNVHTRLSRSNSFSLKKSCLKKRSLSEAMLQRSLSTSTLVQQAVESIVSRGPTTHRDSDSSMPDFLRSRPHFNSSDASGPSSEVTSAASAASSGLETPCEVRCHKRHIHFSEEVEQCIAIDGDLDEYNDDLDEETDEYAFEANEADDEESTARYAASKAVLEEDEGDISDDGVIMMKPEHSKERKLSNMRGSRPGSISIPGRNGTPRSSFSDGGPGTPPPGSANKTIAMLPATRLKYRGDTPEPPETLRAPPSPALGLLGSLAPSASQETLKPSRPSSNFLLDEEDEDMAWQPTAPASSRKGNDVSFLGEEDEEEMRARGLRRTASGMFMPYDESENGDDASSVAVGGGGIFGRVVDTVNTARDIAHVIWNVGWRQ